MDTFRKRPVVVKREREEEEQVPEEVPRKKQRVQKRKLLVRKSICRANLGDPHPDEQIRSVGLLYVLSRYFAAPPDTFPRTVK